jgi:hypothetical protein
VKLTVGNCANKRKFKLWKEIRKGMPALEDLVEIRRHPFFKALDWEQLEKK